jgi:hypothetical protein
MVENDGFTLGFLGFQGLWLLQSFHLDIQTEKWFGPLSSETSSVLQLWHWSFHTWFLHPKCHLLGIGLRGSISVTLRCWETAVVAGLYYLFVLLLS